MVTELSACPFCGHRAAIEDIGWEYRKMGFGTHKKYVVECWKCHSRTQAYNTVEEAVEAWERRTPVASENH